MSTLKSAQIDIYIYDSGNPPTTPQYSISKNLLSGESTINFEVAELIKDYVEIDFRGDYENALLSKNVDIQVTRTFTETCGNGTEVTHTETGNRLKYIAFRGYGEIEDKNLYVDSPYYDKNVNPTLSKDMLISNTKIFHLKDQPLRIPFYNGNDGVHKVEYKKDVTTVKSVILGGNTERITADRDDIKADVDTGASSQIYRADMTHIRNNSSVDTNREELEYEEVNIVNFITHKGFEVSYPIELIEECKHRPYKITFINKFGALQDLWFFKKRTDEFSVEREDYNKTMLTTSSTGVDFSRFTHSNSLLNINNTEKITLNTGFISEDHNEVIRQLMVTEYCWILEDNAIGEEPVPVKPITSSFVIKSEVNDKLLNFEVEFEYANSYIQNVR